MPIYEYLCSSCGHKFELLRPLMDSGKAAQCPKCHKPAQQAVSCFCSVSKDASGATTPIGGGGCGSCGGGSCGTCGS